jgi:16S rRNA processing protein RimM
LVGEWVTVSEDFAPPLPEGEFFHFQLLGLRVISQLGEELGHLTEIIQTGSNDVYLVSDGKGEVLIPAVSQVVQQIDLDAGVMVVELIEGLR